MQNLMHVMVSLLVKLIVSLPGAFVPVKFTSDILFSVTENLSSCMQCGDISFKYVHVICV